MCLDLWVSSVPAQATVPAHDVQIFQGNAHLGGNLFRNKLPRLGLRGCRLVHCWGLQVAWCQLLQRATTLWPTAGDLNKCTACIQPRYMYADGIYVDPASGNCTVCPAGCRACTGPTQCTE